MAAAAEDELDFAEAELTEMDATSAIALHGEEEDADDLYSEFEDEAPISAEQEGSLALKIEADKLREENRELQKELKELREAVSAWAVSRPHGKCSSQSSLSLYLARFPPLIAPCSVFLNLYIHSTSGWRSRMWR
jgi:hypothetical protein